MSKIIDTVVSTLKKRYGEVKLVFSDSIIGTGWPYIQEYLIVSKDLLVRFLYSDAYIYINCLSVDAYEIDDPDSVGQLLYDITYKIAVSERPKTNLYTTENNLTFLSSYGRYILSGDRLGVISEWDFTLNYKRKYKKEVKGEGPITCLSRIPGKLAVAQPFKLTICKTKIDLSYTIDFLVWDSVGKKLAIITQGRIGVLGHRWMSEVGGNYASTCAWSPNNEYLLVGSKMGLIIRWNWRTSKYKKSKLFHQGDVRGIKFFRNGTSFVSFGDDPYICIGNAVTLQLISKFRVGYTDVRDIALVGPYIFVVSEEGVVTVWDIHTKVRIWFAIPFLNYTNMYKFLEDGSAMVSTDTMRQIYVCKLNAIPIKCFNTFVVGWYQKLISNPIFHPRILMKIRSSIQPVYS